MTQWETIQRIAQLLQDLRENEKRIKAEIRLLLRNAGYARKFMPWVKSRAEVKTSRQPTLNRKPKGKRDVIVRVRFGRTNAKVGANVGVSAAVTSRRDIRH